MKTFKAFLTLALALALAAPWTMARAEILAAPGTEDREFKMRPGAVELVAYDAWDNALKLRSETTALRFLAAICIANRNDIRRARQALVANSYVHFADLTGGGATTEIWLHRTSGPLFFLTGSGRRVDECGVFIDKPARRVDDMARLLDELTREDIQRVNPEAAGFERGEWGWILRPSADYGVFLERNDNDSYLYLKAID